jgi:phosphoribosylformimino-5-aminoimidazole carboxamide ribotide isomerase
MNVIPAVDVLSGEVVRLRRGNFGDVSLRRGPPEDVVEHFARSGATMVHVVDLDGSRDGVLDLSLLERVLEAAGEMKVQFAGGVRSPEEAARVIERGAARVVAGTAAFADDGAMTELVAAVGARLVVAVDVSRDEVVSRGWLSRTGISPAAAVAACDRAGVARILCTAVERDGMSRGPDLSLLREVVSLSRIPVIASGGVTSLQDIERLSATGVDECVVGRAFLEGSLPLSVLAG